MSLNFKVSFDLSDFEDDDFLQELRNVYNFYNNVIVLEYKLNKEKKNQQYATLEEIYKTIKDNNLIFYNFDIPAIKKKLKERNL
jgi:endo-alpha-1,4-polygalactosaminidase (GH114 family)